MEGEHNQALTCEEKIFSIKVKNEIIKILKEDLIDKPS